MAIRKPTTTADLTETAEAAGPTDAERVEQIAELTAPEMVADVKAPKTVKVTSPSGFVTEVPEGLAGMLLDSGYSKSK